MYGDGCDCKSDDEIDVKSDNEDMSAMYES